MANEHRKVLESIYDEAIDGLKKPDYVIDINKSTAEQIDMIVEHSEKSKGLATVLMTLLSHKIVDPKQDIRYHQAQQKNGFAGRTIDKAEVTPFMKESNFPAMAESGWLTRSLEQPYPYTLDYQGKIKPEELKQSFLNILDGIEEQNLEAHGILEYYLRCLIVQRDSKNIDLAKPHSLTISQIVEVLRKHFTFKYDCAGQSRLPSLAMYALYQCTTRECKRYNAKELLPLASHNSADTQSGRIGDVDVNNEDSTAYEGVEIKHEIPITVQLIKDAYEKFKIYNTDRYYLLTTADINNADWDKIELEVKKIRQIHGCQVIVGSIYDTLMYHLQLLDNPALFIDHYVELMKIDDTVKFQHKKIWNDIISGAV